MLTRRHLAAGFLIALMGGPALAQPAPPADPAAILTAIYARAAKGKGDGGGSFIIENKAAKAKYLSKSLNALWAKADARTPKDDVGPVDFDPVTNSQDPDVKSFKVDTQKLESDKASLAVTMTGHRNDRKPSDLVVRYDFVREPGGWRIDDIRGASDGQPWSIRKMLAASLKS